MSGEVEVYNTLEHYSEAFEPNPAPRSAHEKLLREKPELLDMLRPATQGELEELRAFITFLNRDKVDPPPLDQKTVVWLSNEASREKQRYAAAALYSSGGLELDKARAGEVAWSKVCDWLGEFVQR